MTRDAFIKFVRAFRRPYASILCATTLAASAVIGSFTGEWMPGALAWVFAAIIIGDGAARMAEKIRGAA